MPRPQTLSEAVAREAAERIDRAREAGEQLSFLPAEPELDQDEAGDGRKPRGPGKAMSQMRAWLASRGYRLPEDVLVEMAGLASSADAVLEAMAKAERILDWAFDGDPAGKRPSSAHRLQVFQYVYAQAVRSAEALLPYGLAKAAPDTVVHQNTVVLMPSDRRQERDPAASARDVTPSAGRRMAPPPLPEEIQRNQRLAASEPEASDGEARTE